MFKVMAILAYIALGTVLVSIYRRERNKSAQPAVQVPNCDLALVHGTGGQLGTRMGSSTVILGTEDA